MDSQRTVDHLRDEANARKDTTLGDLLDTAAEELDDAEDTIEKLQRESSHFKNAYERVVDKNKELIDRLRATKS